ncbi:hypothetical protein HNQ71_007043 [Mesorhizobium sangaii]|uniref:Uncharacterized protein n=1 Tax=Mesorhizobium sangaii TaxID=505389 RepID=A0A841PL46_9HYPH|nr:hypothetical protein [Mesorhizobium sangaii]
MKTLTSQKRRALLTARKLLQEKAIAIENDSRGLLRTSDFCNGPRQVNPLLRHPIAGVSLLYGVGATAAT